MFKNMKLGTKIVSGFALVLLLLCAVVAIGIYGQRMITDCVEKADSMNTLMVGLMEARRQEKNFLLRKDQTYVARVEEIVKGLIAKAQKAKSKFDQKFYQDKMDEVVTEINKYSQAFTTCVEIIKQRDDTMTKMRAEAGRALGECEFIRADQKRQLIEGRKKMTEEARKLNGGQASEMEKLNVQKEAFTNDKITKADDANRIIKFFLDARKNEKEFIISGGQKKWKDLVLQNVASILKLAEDMKNRFKQAQNQQQAEKIMQAVKSYRALFLAYAGLLDKQAEMDKIMVATARQAEKVCNQLRRDQQTKMNEQISLCGAIMIVGAGLAIALGVILAFLITRAITKPINSIIAGLNEGSSQVAAAANQVSTASQSLAEGASEQASSLEETSASLEEVTSMTKRNAENAQQADSLMQEADRVVQNANSSMKELRRAMDKINTASDETAKIIKTIDEIAFQTNLLALNAAVEAARAGEAGAGFAVVADEVRNLAMRAAEAAKNTQHLIEENIKDIKNGSQLVATTDEAFSQVEENSHKVGELVGEIAAASREQSQGIEQINQAMVEIDKVTQTNAANAEESAAASEELSAQAETMQGFVSGLVDLVGGATNTNPEVQDRFSLRRRKTKIKALPAPAKTAKMDKAPKPNVKAEKAIPLEDRDFKDF